MKMLMRESNGTVTLRNGIDIDIDNNNGCNVVRYNI